jgi:hypothetical protein
MGSKKPATTRAPVRPGVERPGLYLCRGSQEHYEANEERQLRLGLGQVLRYRQVLSTGGNPTKAVLAIERAPRDKTRVSLCRELDVMLCWPPAFDGASAGSFASASDE